MEVQYQIDPHTGKGSFILEHFMWARSHLEAAICLYHPFSVCPVGHTPSHGIVSYFQ